MSIETNDMAHSLLNIFSEYLDDYTLEEFFDDCGLTNKGKELLKDIRDILNEGAI
tara:strand:+ start:382 stop:546 length:165 start_codon:yes stop_codon:yes gene_type:complete